MLGKVDAADGVMDEICTRAVCTREKLYKRAEFFAQEAHESTRSG